MMERDTPRAKVNPEALRLYWKQVLADTQWFRDRFFPKGNHVGEQDNGFVDGGSAI